MIKTFDEICDIVSSEINRLNWDKEPKGLYEPIEYILSLGGKRLRPAMTLMACNLYTENILAAANSALGIEIFHNFTLLHDDIMDNADIRRGKPTVHVKWNNNTAILSGDVMQISSYQLMTETPSPNLKRSLDLFSKTAAQICEGQQYDVEFEKMEHVSETDYIEMIRLKTAVLMAAGLQIGAWIGGSTDKDAQLLYDFGINIGLAFQLKDDLLDVYGDEATFGKKIGGDILCNKKTFLLINAINLAKGEKKEQLHYWLGCSDISKSTNKIKAMTALFSELGADKICEEKMNHFYNLAIAKLDLLSIEQSKTQELRKLSQKMMSRKE
jgi:geranylgeranyl diphosphate synthase, type II